MVEVKEESERRMDTCIVVGGERETCAWCGRTLFIVLGTLPSSNVMIAMQNFGFVEGSVTLRSYMYPCGKPYSKF